MTAATLATHWSLHIWLVIYNQCLISIEVQLTHEFSGLAHLSIPPWKGNYSKGQHLRVGHTGCL